MNLAPKKNTKKNLVSIIIPYFKKKQFFLESFNSVYYQSYKKKEIIIIYDDPDQSDLSFIKKIIKNKRNTYLYINRKKHGAGTSRNLAIRKSKGEFLAFIDSDDVWDKQKLTKQIKFMKKNNISASFTSYSIIDFFGKQIGYRKAKKVITLNDLIYSCDIGLSTVVLRKGKIINNKLRFPNLKTKEDYVLWISLAKKNVKFFGLENNFVKWRRLKNSLSSSLIQKLLDGFRVYNIYLKFNFFKSILYLFLLSINYLKKSI